MIRLTSDQEQALGRVVKAQALLHLQDIFEVEKKRVQAEYDRVKETLIVSGEGRSVGLQLRGRLVLLEEIIELLERQGI